jgi:hypothetical protein
VSATGQQRLGPQSTTDQHPNLQTLPLTGAAGRVFGDPKAAAFCETSPAPGNTYGAHASTVSFTALFPAPFTVLFRQRRVPAMGLLATIGGLHNAHGEE